MNENEPLFLFRFEYTPIALHNFSISSIDTIIPRREASAAVKPRSVIIIFVFSVTVNTKLSNGELRIFEANYRFLKKMMPGKLVQYYIHHELYNNYFSLTLICMKY